MKMCNKCNIEKEIIDFYFRKDLNKYMDYCVKCYNLSRKEYVKKNIDKIKKYKANWFQNNKFGQRQKNKEYYKSHPWVKTLDHIQQRCSNLGNSSYNNYGGKGIKCLITSKELKQLWVRDNASSMKRPSIDRIDSNDHYKYNNCRYLELKINCCIEKMKSVTQYTLEGKIIKIFKSISEASRETNLHISGISRCCRNESKTCGKFIWRF